jgi:kojibiose phosphorylase
VSELALSVDSLREWSARVVRASGEPWWTLREEDYDPLLEREVESRFSIGNGLIGVRGSLETPTMSSRPRTYVAGLYDIVPDSPVNPVLVPAPDWLRFVLTIDGEELTIEEGKALAHRRTLDLRSGSLVAEWDHRLPAGHLVHLSTLRLASLDDRCLLMQVVRLECDSHAEFSLEALLAPVAEALVFEKMTGSVSLWRTAGSGRGLAIAMNAQLYLRNASSVSDESNKGLGPRWSWTNTSNEVATLIRTVGIARDDKTREASVGALTGAIAKAPTEIFASHAEKWSERWQASDVVIDGDEQSQQAVRFAIYHLISAANPDEEHASIGARGLTGDAYSGHVFWDTEIFLLPFYTLTWPDAARALLMYRYHTLPAARAKASRLGYQGALYAWESADSGEETTPDSAQLPTGEIIPILTGAQEHHISTAVAFAVWQYWQVTSDEKFLLEAGAEIVLETARFWASRAALAADGRYHIRRVIGPDEYHEGVDDNAYTNVMAQWNLEIGLAVASLVESGWPDRWAEVRDALELREPELALWRDVAERISTGFDTETGLFEQFGGFFELEPVNLGAYDERTAPIDVLLGRERTQRSQVIKQADVVMLLSLLWERFSPDIRAANFRYYEPRTAHGSSLSPAVHALVAARLGELELAQRYFLETASIDLGDTMGNAAGGIHMAALGGLWQSVVFGFAGLSLTADGLSFQPHLPKRWRSLSFAIRWHDSVVQVRILDQPPALRARLREGNPVTVTVAGEGHTMRRSEEHDWQLGLVKSKRDRP